MTVGPILLISDTIADKCIQGGFSEAIAASFVVCAEGHDGETCQSFEFGSYFYILTQYNIRNIIFVLKSLLPPPLEESETRQ